MIYTLTLNPAVDVYMNFDEIVTGSLNRTNEQKINIGGKGINVSLALKNLGIKSIPILVVGGFTGEYIKSRIEKEFDIKLFYSMETTRINVKIKSKEEETEYNGKNTVEEKILGDIHQYLLNLNKEDYLVVSGNASLFTYNKILSNVNCKLILDIDGNRLKNLLHLKPFLVKPNNQELKELSEDIEEAYSILLKESEYVLHTKGKGGGTLLSKEERYELVGQEVQEVSTVGCGDAALAGFLAYFLKGKSLKKCLDFSNECGSFRAKTGQFLIQN